MAHTNTQKEAEIWTGQWTRSVKHMTKTMIIRLHATLSEIHSHIRRLHKVMTCLSQPTTFLMPFETSVDLFAIDDDVFGIVSGDEVKCWTGWWLLGILAVG